VLMNSGEQTPEQRRLIRGACTLDGKDVAPGNLLPIAVHEGVSVAWLPLSFDKPLETSSAKMVAVGAAGVVGLIILL